MAIGNLPVFLLSGVMLLVLLVALLIFPADIFVAETQMLLASKQTEGTILSCRVVASRHKAGSNADYRYRTEVSYEYVVKGQRLTGTRLAPGFMGFVKSTDGGEVARKYPVSTNVIVYYNPRCPEFAFVERSFRSLSAGIGLFSVSLLILGFLKQFCPTDSQPRSLRALLYASLPVGILMCLTLPEYFDIPILMSKAHIYGSLYAGIYLILLIKSRWGSKSTFCSS